MARQYNKKLRPLELQEIPAEAIGANFHKVGNHIEQDAAEAASTTLIINATAHNAQIGDQIIISSGSLKGEAREARLITTNTVTVDVAFSGSPASGDTFEILRPQLAQQVGLLSVENVTDVRIFLSIDGQKRNYTVNNNVTKSWDLRTNNYRLGHDNTNFTESNEDLIQWLWIKHSGTAPTYEGVFVEMTQ